MLRSDTLSAEEALANQKQLDDKN